LGSPALGALHAEDQHIGMAKLRGRAAATTFVSLSALLWVTSLPWASVIGGIPFYDPVLLHFYRWAFLTSLAGLLTGILGKRKVEMAIGWTLEFQ
jgi:hypothetical protein